MYFHDSQIEEVKDYFFNMKEIVEEISSNFYLE